MDYITTSKTIHSLEKTSKTSVTRREFVTGFMSLFIMNIQSVLAQESGKEKPAISMEDFMKELNRNSTYKQPNYQGDLSKSFVDNLSLIYKLLHAYDLLDDEIEKILTTTFQQVNDPKNAVLSTKKQLFQKGYFLNLNNQIIGGILLQKGTTGMLNLGDSSLVTKIFGETVSDIKIPSITIDDIHFGPSGAADLEVGTIILNTARISRAYQSYQQMMADVSNPVFLNVVDYQTYSNFTRVNEVCHGVLTKKYDFNNLSDIPWEKELGKLYVGQLIDNQSISELISDGLSFISGPVPQTFALLLWKSISTSVPGYRLSRAVLFSYIEEVLRKKTKTPQVKELLHAIENMWLGKGASITQQQMFLSIMKHMNKQDVGYVANNFLKYTQHLISIIKKHAPKK